MYVSVCLNMHFPFIAVDSVDVLLDVYGSNRDAQCDCLLVMRNLCFHGPAKTLLASNGMYKCHGWLTDSN